MTIDLILARLQKAAITKDVFGELKGSLDEKLDEIKSIFNQMAKLVHPDKAPGDKMAEEAFKLLNNFYDRAQEEVKNDRYGEVLRTSIKSKKNTYTVAEKGISGDLSNVYFTEQGAILKIAKEISLNKYLDKEAENLKKIHKQKHGQFQVLADSHVPNLIESFQIDGKATNVIKTWKFKAYSLEQVKQQYPSGVDGRHMAWIFKRLLAAIAIANEVGLVHSHIIPSNFLICPEDHNGLLIDWCGAVENGQTVGFQVSKYQEFYAPEIWLKQKVSFGTDVYMAAKLMVYILGNNTNIPNSINNFINSLLIKTPSLRPNNAFDILEDFDDTLKDVYGKPKWVDLKMS